MMNRLIESMIRPIFQRTGFDIVRHRKSLYPPDFSAENIDICDLARPYTMTSPERINALIHAVEYVVTNNIPGAFVECGVWKGGSTMAMLHALMRLGPERRSVYLYDTFSGMSAPSDVDISVRGEPARQKFSRTKTSNDSSDWCFSPLAEVKNNVFNTGYDKEEVHFVEGKVEETIPDTIPDDIAILRLDTDWYESTKHELVHLFPLLRKDGVLIIDDYGHWQGARKAVDEYILDNKIRILLNRIDHTGRIAIKS